METKQIKILAIDDHQDNLISLKALIREAFPDAAILTALSGAAGLELAAAEDPDVILLDIVMPGMDGFEVCRRLKADTSLSDIPVVFITALKGDKESRIQALDCGAEAFLAKPIDEIELTAQIRAMVKIKSANLEKRHEMAHLAALVEEQTRTLKKAHTATLNLMEDLKAENAARKKSEEELKESQEKFSKAFQTSPYAITITSVDDGYFVEINDTFTAMTGYTREEATANSSIGLNLWVNPHDRKLVTSALLEGKVLKDHEFKFRIKNGEIITVSFSAQIVHLKNKPYILSSIDDITDRKKMEELQSFLAETNTVTTDDDFFEELAAYLATSLDMAFICIDRLEGDGLSATTLAVWCDGVFEDNVTYALKDTPCGDVVGRTVCCFPDQVCQLFPHDQVLQDMRAESYIGVTLWSHTGQPIGLIAVIGRSPLKNRPLAETMLKLVAVRAAGELERMDAKLALRASEKKFRTMIETLPLAIYMSTGTEQVANYVNPTMIKLFGYTLKDIPTVEKWWPLAYPDETYRREISEMWNQRVVRAITTQSTFEPMEVVVTCKNGSKKNVVWDFITMGDKNYACGLDITERKHYEQELQNKNSELERFTYTVSHDLKSPLITINTFAGMVLQDIKTGRPANIPEDLGRVCDAANKMGLLLDDLLQLSRIGRMLNEPSRIDMNALITDTLSLLEGTIQQQQAEIIVQPDLPNIFGDRQRIAMVLQNLLENAFKYSKNQATPRIEIGAIEKGTEAFFFVSDNGIGIAPHQHEHIFGLFKQLDAKSQGTGIGLALVKRIIELHGGRIWVESEGTGTGSKFLFTVPERHDKFTKPIKTSTAELLRDNDVCSTH